MKPEDQEKAVKHDCMILRSYSVQINGVAGLCKSPALWGNRLNENCCMPLCYFRKPKWISQQSFEAILKGIKLELPRDFFITSEE